MDKLIELFETNRDVAVIRLALASVALHGIIQSPNYSGATMEGQVDYAYKYADAMLQKLK